MKLFLFCNVVLKISPNADWCTCLEGRKTFKKNLLDNRKQCFEKLDEDLIAVLQLKAYIVRLNPRQILKTHKYILNFSACSSL